MSTTTEEEEAAFQHCIGVSDAHSWGCPVEQRAWQEYVALLPGEPSRAVIGDIPEICDRQCEEASA